MIDNIKFYTQGNITIYKLLGKNCAIFACIFPFNIKLVNISDTFGNT